MIETSDEIAPVHPAATVILMREAATGPEVLLVQRSRAVRHMGGEWVFPGGRVDPEDDPGDGDPYGSAVNAAIRETREEAGLSIEADQLAHLSHWTTPEGAKRRFATWFFLAVLEDDQEVRVDGGEIALHRWVAPGAALEEVRDTGSPFRLMPPTFVSLVELATYGDCRAARAAIGGREPLVYAPNMVFIEGGACFLYEGDAGYACGDPALPGLRHRTYMFGDQLEYIRES
ncbi:NUDIX hydrolase [Parahaliea mediterranea]|uniref:NUDIX hydrolase n=1 Tax=Parahaliea mediterranea TaxID=651086 RepID=A0A939ILJ7_9GAMM|nr:NUDIX hydrolase [Parahaliea mediterranea]MBN7798466.1 NUDIX hydrolase [Parahaliea mediterranea]